MSHQIECLQKAVPRIQKTGGFYTMWDPGTGKTLEAICQLKKLGVRRILVLAPVVAVGVWADPNPEVGQLAHWWPEADAVVLRDQSWIDYFGSAKVRAQWSSGTTDTPLCFVTNYDQLVGKTGKKRLERLLKVGYDALVLDEAQYIKGPNTQRTKATVKLDERCDYRLLLSGTPAHSPLDWWSQMRLICPSEPVWNVKFSTYREWIAIPGGPNGRWERGFHPHAVALALKTMDPYTHTVKVEQLGLPEPITTVVPVELSPYERRAYDQMESQLVVEIEGEERMTAQIALTKMLRLQQITAGHLQDSGYPSTKMKACLDLLEERSHKKVVIACRFKPEMRELKKHLEKIKRPYMVISGETPQAERPRIQARFQGEDKPYVLLLQYRAGGMSLTLTRAAALILYSLESSYINYQQMIGRVYRKGTTTHVQILPLIATDTYDQIVYGGLQTKATEEDLARLLIAFAKRRKK
jgi:SNF2 family DNA or RNA helicase